MTNERQREIGLELLAQVEEIEALMPELREQGHGAVLDRLKRAGEIWAMPRGPERDAAMRALIEERDPPLNKLHNRRPARRP